MGEENFIDQLNMAAWMNSNEELESNSTSEVPEQLRDLLDKAKDAVEAYRSALEDLCNEHDVEFYQ